MELDGFWFVATTDLSRHSASDVSALLTMLPFATALLVRKRRESVAGSAASALCGSATCERTHRRASATTGTETSNR